MSPQPPPNSTPLRVALHNDYEIVLAGLRAMLEPFPDRVRVVTEDLGPSNGEPTRVDVALIDTFALLDGGRERIGQLARDPRVAHVVVFSFDNDEHRVSEALAAGAHGFISKSATPEQLLADLERVGQGEVVVGPAGFRRHSGQRAWPGRDLGLSEREAQVLALVAAGQRNTEIAEALFLSPDTVKTHLRSVFRKLGVRNRAAAVALALRDNSFRLMSAAQERSSS